MATAIRVRLRQMDAQDDVAAFYRQRRFRPIWAPGEVRPEAIWLAERLAERDRKHRALLRDLKRAPRDPWSLAGLELRLSAAYATEMVLALKGGPGQPLEFVDPQLAYAEGRARKALRTAASARDLQAHLEKALTEENRIYAGLAEALARYRETWAGLPNVVVPPGPTLQPGARGPRLAALRERLGLPRAGGYDSELVDLVSAFQRAHGLPDTGLADAATIRALNLGPQHYERLLEANLERAAALPASLGERFILVDAAAGQLWYHDDGELKATMKVVTGKPSEPTPMMAGLVRHLIFNPYWNVPEDLVRTSIAPKVLARGVRYVEEEGLEVLSDYSENAVPLDPHTLDWRAVQRGELKVRVRQRPGPKNMMGRVKLMLPNPLGVYLHDTPNKGDFAKSQRLASSGCVRLEDAMTLAKLLVGEARAERAADGSSEERRIDLAEPVPVYITYFTAMPTPEGVVFRPDVYGRDSRRVAGLSRSAGRD